LACYDSTTDYGLISGQGCRGESAQNHPYSRVETLFVGLDALQSF